jgi:hypothetical protein
MAILKSGGLLEYVFSPLPPGITLVDPFTDPDQNGNTYKQGILLATGATPFPGVGGSIIWQGDAPWAPVEVSRMPVAFNITPTGMINGVTFEIRNVSAPAIDTTGRLYFTLVQPSHGFGV